MLQFWSSRCDGKFAVGFEIFLKTVVLPQRLSSLDVMSGTGSWPVDALRPTEKSVIKNPGSLMAALSS